MAQAIQDVMTRTTRTLGPEASVQEAARIMADDDIGAVIVVSDGAVSGIVTDRDIVVRSTAEGRAPGEVTVGEVASGDVVTVAPTDTVGDVVELVRDRAIRRVPVVDGGRPVGFVSIGDLAIERDSRSALADVSAAEGNN
jgi:CBS domain-containing protein